MEPRRRPQQRLSNAYLIQAVEALEFAGSAAMLYRSVDDDMLGEHGPENDVIRGRARWEHQNHCRQAVLYAALAAESYVNEFLAATLTSQKDVEALDRLSTPDKYAVAVRTAVGDDLFSRGAEPHNTIVEIFKLRSRLVHPKPGWGPANPYFDPPGTFEALFAPARVVACIVRTAQAAEVLIRKAYPLDHIDHTANFIWEGRRALEDFAHGLEHDGLPAPGAPNPDPRLVDRCLDLYKRGR